MFIFSFPRQLETTGKRSVFSSYFSSGAWTNVPQTAADAIDSFTVSGFTDCYDSVQVGVAPNGNTIFVYQLATSSSTSSVSYITWNGGILLTSKNLTIVFSSPNVFNFAGYTSSSSVAPAVVVSSDNSFHIWFGTLIAQAPFNNQWALVWKILDPGKE